jgi:hypothetical protein
MSDGIVPASGNFLGDGFFADIEVLYLRQVAGSYIMGHDMEPASHTYDTP